MLEKLAEFLTAQQLETLRLEQEMEEARKIKQKRRFEAEDNLPPTQEDIQLQKIVNQRKAEEEKVAKGFVALAMAFNESLKKYQDVKALKLNVHPSKIPAIPSIDISGKLSQLGFNIN